MREKIEVWVSFLFSLSAIGFDFDFIGPWDVKYLEEMPQAQKPCQWDLNCFWVFGSYSEDLNLWLDLS